VRYALTVLVVIFGIAAFLSPASASEPLVPPGKGTVGKVTVALLGPGIDYRLPELKGRLARDGEGDLISWDFSDNDNKPFAEGGIGNDAAAILTATPSAGLVIAKEKLSDPQAFGHMMAFVAKTPARIVVWLSADPLRPDWPIMVEAASHFRDRLFLIPNAKRKFDETFKRLRDQPNVVVVDLVEPSTLDRLLIGGVRSTGFTMGLLAGTAAERWAQKPTLTSAELKVMIAPDKRPATQR